MSVQRLVSKWTFNQPHTHTHYHRSIIWVFGIHHTSTKLLIFIMNPLINKSPFLIPVRLLHPFAYIIHSCIIVISNFSNKNNDNPSITQSILSKSIVIYIDIRPFFLLIYCRLAFTSDIMLTISSTHQFITFCTIHCVSLHQKTLSRLIH